MQRHKERNTYFRVLLLASEREIPGSRSDYYVWGFNINIKCRDKRENIRQNFTKSPKGTLEKGKGTPTQEEWQFQGIYYVQLPVPCLQTQLWEHLHLFLLSNVKTVIFTCPLLFFHEWPLLPGCWLPSSCCSTNSILQNILTEIPGMTGRLVDSLWFPVSFSKLLLNLLVTWPTKVNTHSLVMSGTVPEFCLFAFCHYWN